MIIAEISCNHNGVKENAIELIKQAKYSGADAVKFQYFEPELMSADIPLTDTKWKSRTYLDLYKKAYTPVEWFEELCGFARDMGLLVVISVYYKSVIEEVMKFEPDYLKISSMEIYDYDLITEASKNSPVIVSCGLMPARDVIKMLSTIKIKHRITLMYCVTEYPTPEEQVDLTELINLRSIAVRFNCDIGLSDHSKINIVPIIATVLGATVIEKHLKLDRSETLDFFSLTPNEFYMMSDLVKRTRKMLTRKERKDNYALYGRSIYAARDIRSGEKLTAKDFILLRPGLGLKPYELLNVDTAVIDIPKHTPITTENVTLKSV